MGPSSHQKSSGPETKTCPPLSPSPKEKAYRFEQRICKEEKETTPPSVAYFSDKYIFWFLLFPKLFLIFYCVFELQGQMKCRRSHLRRFCRPTLSLNKNVCTTHRGGDPEQDILDLEGSPSPPLVSAKIPAVFL